jgi:NDP-sugar pyrophosphorylase family protein
MTRARQRKPNRSKQRLTITLSPEVLDQVDAAIDNQGLGNRSHAIEVLLRKALAPVVDTAVVLAGGDHSEGLNPALATIDGQALICLTIGHLSRFGIRNVVVVAGDDIDRIESLVGDGHSIGVSVTYIREGQPLGTAGALKLAAAALARGPFMVVHGDVLTNMDARDFVEFHHGAGTLATIAVKPRRSERTYGRVTIQGTRVTDFDAGGAAEGISIVNTGLYIMQPQVLNLIDDAGPSMLEDQLFPLLAGMGELTAFVFQGLWYDVRDPDRQKLAESEWRQRGGHHVQH